MCHLTRYTSRPHHFTSKVHFPFPVSLHKQGKLPAPCITSQTRYTSRSLRIKVHFPFFSSLHKGKLPVPCITPRTRYTFRSLHPSTNGVHFPLPALLYTQGTLPVPCITPQTRYTSRFSCINSQTSYISRSLHHYTNKVHVPSPASLQLKISDNQTREERN